MGIFPQTPSCTNLSFVDTPNPLTVHSYLLHTLHVFVATRGLTFVQTIPLPSLRPTVPTPSLQVSVTWYAVARFTYSHLHMVPECLPSYINRTGSGWTDGRDIYGVIRCGPLIVDWGVGTQLPRRPVMRRRPNPGAGWGCYLFPSKFMGVKVG